MYILIHWTVLISVMCSYILSSLMPPLQRLSHTECLRSPEAHRSYTHTQTLIRIFKEAKENCQSRCSDVLLYVPVWNWISRVIRQFQESPAAAHFSSLPCRLTVNIQRYSVRFFNLISGSNCYMLTEHVLWVCAYIPYESDSQFKKNTQFRRHRVAAEKAVSVEKSREDTCRLRESCWDLDLGWGKISIFISAHLY